MSDPIVGDNQKSAEVINLLSYMIRPERDPSLPCAIVEQELNGLWSVLIVSGAGCFFLCSEVPRDVAIASAFNEAERLPCDIYIHGDYTGVR